MNSLEARIDNLAESVTKKKKLDGLLFQSTAISYDDKSNELLIGGSPCYRERPVPRLKTRQQSVPDNKPNHNPMKLLLTELSGVTQTLNSLDASIETSNRTTSRQTTVHSAFNSYHMPKLMYVTPKTDTNKLIVESFRKLHRKYRVVRGEERSLQDCYTGLMRNAKMILRKTAYQYFKD